MLLTPFLSFFTVAFAIAPSKRGIPSDPVCQQIAGQITGKVYYKIDLTGRFLQDIQHWMTSSTQTPQCVVEVESPWDVSKVLMIVGSKRTPFAVKSGGHASSPGFSSTNGVFISLVKMKQIVLSADKSTVEVGLGNIWSEVYKALDGTGFNVVGGRVVGPGTGGFTLGGGYSWLTNQYGLTCDTVQTFNLVLPDGTITAVDSSKPDLFFALKGGLNRFGIVTSIVYKTVPQPELVYGGLQLYDYSQSAALVNATKKFQDQNDDPKAQVILTLNSGTLPNAILLTFYDGPSSPTSFDVFNDIPALISSAKSQSFNSFSQAAPATLQAGSRGAFGSLSTTTLTLPFLNAIKNETDFWGGMALLHTGGFISYDIEPFGKYGKHATDSAYPHADSQLPLNLYFSWTSPAEDTFWRSSMQTSLNHLIEVAKAEGIYNPLIYPNYALDTATGTQLYGAVDTARLRSIQAKYDPERVMELAGGFAF